MAVNVWVTAGDKSQLLSQQNDILFQPGTGSGGTPISVVPTTTYQTMSGFGAAMTDSSAWLLQNKLTAAQRDKLMRQMFSPQSGIGINYLRVPLGRFGFHGVEFLHVRRQSAGRHRRVSTAVFHQPRPGVHHSAAAAGPAAQSKLWVCSPVRGVRPPG